MVQLSHKTDDQLVEAYVNGCNEAFDVLLSRHQDNLYNYISYHLSSNAENIDDVFQETFVRVIVSLKEGRYTKAGYFGAWLNRIAHNIIMDQYRIDSLLPIVDREHDERDVTAIAGAVENSLEAQIISAQTLADVKRLMDHLPEPQREVIYLRYYEDLSFKEIASTTGVSINTSLGRFRYGINNMRRMAQKYNILAD